MREQLNSPRACGVVLGLELGQGYPEAGGKMGMEGGGECGCLSFLVFLVISLIIYLSLHKLFSSLCALHFLSVTREHEGHHLGLPRGQGKIRHGPRKKL